jgi:arsenate reductase (glutaredoxin)
MKTAGQSRGGAPQASRVEGREAVTRLCKPHIAMHITNLQIFGTRKCSGTRKAERIFKERRMSFQLVDIAVKGPSAGELRKIANAVGGMDKLIDREGKRYLERGLKYATPTGPRIEQMLVDDPLLLRTPLVRAGDRATVGEAVQAWSEWLAT